MLTQKIESSNTQKSWPFLPSCKQKQRCMHNNARVTDDIFLFVFLIMILVFSQNLPLADDEICSSNSSLLALWDHILKKDQE